MQGDKINTAIELMIQHVPESGIESPKIYKLAKRAGVSGRTLERAKAAVGVESKRDGNKRIWVMTDEQRANLSSTINNQPNLPITYISNKMGRTPFVEVYSENLPETAKPLNISELGQIFLICEPIIFQGKFDYFAGYVPHILEKNIMSGNAFVFCSRSKTQISILQWQGDGYALFYKRSEYGRFPWPVNTGTQAIEISLEDLKMLMEYPRLALRLTGKATPSVII